MNVDFGDIVDRVGSRIAVVVEWCRDAVMRMMDRKGMIAAGRFVKYSVLRQQRRAEKWL